MYVIIKAKSQQLSVRSIDSLASISLQVICVCFYRNHSFLLIIQSVWVDFSKLCERLLGFLKSQSILNSFIESIAGMKTYFSSDSRRHEQTFTNKNMTRLDCFPPLLRRFYVLSLHCKSNSPVQMQIKTKTSLFRTNLFPVFSKNFFEHSLLTAMTVLQIESVWDAMVTHLWPHMVNERRLGNGVVNKMHSCRNIGGTQSISLLYFHRWYNWITFLLRHTYRNSL